MSDLIKLAGVFGYLSLLTMGGGMAAFPEMKRLTVEVQHWLTFPQLMHLYSVGQMGPGPNMMMVVAVGRWASGFLGAVVVVVAFFGPTALLALTTGRLWKRLEAWPWRASIQKGLAPVSVGLLLAGCFTMARAAVTGLDTATIAVAVLLILLRFKVNPALLILASAIVGVFSFGLQ
ncbi:MAG TPA: chromate transporter [Vicinamibacteria bacterium]|nr:chromate transporter [Vicinamibacteria bacterium]